MKFQVLYRLVIAKMLFLPNVQSFQVSFIFKEKCYFDFDETSEFSPYAKSLYCSQYISIDDIILAIIIISLSTLTFYTKYIEKNQNLQKIANLLSISDDLTKQIKEHKDEIQSIENLIYANLEDKLKCVREEKKKDCMVCYEFICDIYRLIEVFIIVKYIHTYNIKYIYKIFPFFL